MATRLKPLWPTLISVLFASVYILWRLACASWDPVVLAQIGSRFAEGDPTGSEGYDGQFAYYITADLNPATVSEHLDVPAYRYQRILYPLLARLAAGGNPVGIPWTLLAVNLLVHAIGTWVVTQILLDGGLSSWYGLIYGLWVGLIASVGHDLYEPLAFALIAGGFLARARGRDLLGAALFGLSLFAKETTLIFWGAVLFSDILQRKSLRSIVGLLAGGAVFALWQVWLWRVFGAPGLVSGGAKATPFEWIPLMGLLRIGAVSLSVLGLFIFLFGPTIVFPAVWGVVVSVKTFLEGRKLEESVVLLASSTIIFFLPFSTFREPLGLLRFATGLIFAVILFSTRQGLKKPLNIGMFWIAMLAILVNQ
jgi:hypothetical protein